MRFVAAGVRKRPLLIYRGGQPPRTKAVTGHSTPNQAQLAKRHEDKLRSEANKSEGEQTLDPEDWDALRHLGHRMIDDMFQYLKSVDSRPTWQPVPDNVKAQLDEPLPGLPADPEWVYGQFKRYILPYPTGNIHPRFWGWVMGTGTPLAMLADMLASGMNSHIAGYDQAATFVASGRSTNG